MDNEMKAAIDALIKDLDQNEKALEAIPPAPPMQATKESPQLEKLVSLTKAQADKAFAAYAEMGKEIDKLEAELEAAMAEALAQCKAAADKATKAYMEAIKATDGLTTAKPSIVAVLKETGKSPDPEALKTAVDELEKHSAEMAKKYGKDKDKAKMLAAFDKDLELAVKALRGLI